MPGGQFSHFRDKMIEPRPGHGTPSVGQFRDDPGHSGTVGKPSNGVCGDITLMYTSTTTLTASLYD